MSKRVKIVYGSMFSNEKQNVNCIKKMVISGTKLSFKAISANMLLFVGCLKIFAALNLCLFQTYSTYLRQSENEGGRKEGKRGTGGRSLIMIKGQSHCWVSPARCVDPLHDFPHIFLRLFLPSLLPSFNSIIHP